MNQIFRAFLIVALLVTISCGPSEEEKARTKMKLIQTLLQEHDTTNALIHIDSIALLFPGAAYSINAAKNLKNEILFLILRNKLAELEKTDKRISELEANFDKGKTDYDRYHHYQYKRQNSENSWNRSYIKVNLDERGEISLTSNYFGQQSLDHTAVKIYDQGDVIVSDEVPLENVDNNHGNFMETKWEQVTYRDETARVLIQFIAVNADRKLKAAFLGKKNYCIVLEDHDKQAIKDAFQLSEALRRKTVLVNETTALQKKISIP